MFKKNLADLKAYQPGPSIEEIRKAYDLPRLVKLDSNENVYGASPAVRKAVVSCALLPELYPDCRDTALRSDLSRRLGVSEDQFLFGLGLDEIIVLISRAFLSSGDSIVMAWPTFYEYYCHAQIEGAVTRKIPVDASGRHDLKAMRTAIDETTRIVWVCNPNNPTGTYITHSELSAFLDQVPDDVIVVLDEAYVDFVTAEDFPRSIELMKSHSNLVVLRTFSKSYGLASFRIGYALGARRIIDEIDKVRPPFNNPHLSQVAAYAALQDQAFKDLCVQKNRDVRDMVSKFLDRRQIPYYPTQANFIFIKTDHPADVAEKCKRNGFLINPFETGIRITLGKKDDMKALLRLLDGILSEPSAEPSV